jgi:hypothetical protein
MKLLYILLTTIMLPFYAFCTSKHTKEVNRIVNPFLKELEKKGKIYAFGYGGAFMHDVEEIDISLCTKRIVDVEKARLLIVSITEELLKRINTDEGIRPYLHNYPFTNENLSITLNFRDKNDDPMLPPFLTYTGVMYGKVGYALQNLKQPLAVDYVHRETYEEALKIYKAQTSSNKPTTSIE